MFLLSINISDCNSNNKDLLQVNDLLIDEESETYTLFLDKMNDLIQESIKTKD